MSEHRLNNGLALNTSHKPLSKSNLVSKLCVVSVDA